MQIENLIPQIASASTTQFIVFFQDLGCFKSFVVSRYPHHEQENEMWKLAIKEGVMVVMTLESKVKLQVIVMSNEFCAGLSECCFREENVMNRPGYVLMLTLK